MSLEIPCTSLEAVLFNSDESMLASTEDCVFAFYSILSSGN